MLESTSSRFEEFRKSDLSKYSPLDDHPFRMLVQKDGRIGFSPGVVRPSLSYGLPAFVPTLYGQQLKSIASGQLTTVPADSGRYFIETSGMWITLAAIEPRNLRVFLPTTGDIKHETDIAFGDPNKKLVLIGSVQANNVVNQVIRSDLTMADIVDTPYTGVPGVGPYDPIVWPEWPTGSNGVIQYGHNSSGEDTGGEAAMTGEDMFTPA